MDTNRSQNLQKLAEKMGNIFRNLVLPNIHKIGEVSLGRPQIGILFILQKNKEGVSVKDLAEKLHVTPGAITQLVDKLVEKKLVERLEDENDRRILKIRLTDTAKDKFKMFKENYLNSISEMFNELDDNELISLVNLLEKIKITKH